MKGFWWVNRLPIWIMLLLLIGFFQLNSMFCRSLNYEGIALLKFRERVNDPFGALSSWNEIGETDPCSWFGIECADGHVVSLNLENLCLEGTLAPELHHLLYIKSILLRNNSFSGYIPDEIRDLKELEFLDLGYNNFGEPLLPEYGYNIPVLFLDNNGLSCHITSEHEELMVLSEAELDDMEVFPHTRHNRKSRMLAEQPAGTPPSSPAPDNNSSKGVFPPPIHVDAFREEIPATDVPDKSRALPSPKHVTQPMPPLSSESPPPPSALSPPRQPPPVLATPAGLPPVASLPVPSLTSEKKPVNMVPVVLGAVGGFIGLVFIIGLYLWTGKRIRKGGPWANGLSGQLQKAFVTGIPDLKRSELETACEDFSNVIGTCSIGTIYKGTLSNGVEIAVIALAASSAKDWSKNLETQFRKKIETLSKVNHKNFVNLIGYCEEEEPFTRMMVFEYAPNGSLFEHLHVREAEHLDWGMRLRVALGMAYCLEHMHQLVPSVTHPNLNSSAVNLAEDYAAQVSDFCFWNEMAAAQVQPIGLANLTTSSASPESNVYSFGLVLLEMMTGRIPHIVDNNDSVEDWVLEYFRAEKPLQELVDPMLRHFSPEQLEKISGVIRKCLHSDPQLRPTMKDVTARLKEITGIDRDKAVPRSSPFWWAELDGRSPMEGR